MSEHDALARQVAIERGLPEPVFIRHGINSLYAIGDDAVLRIGPLPFGPEVEGAWLDTLARIGVRGPRLLQPVEERDGLGVALLARIEPAGEVDWREVGAMIRRVHDLDPASVPALPWCGDFGHWQVDGLLDEQRDAIDPPALAGLEACLRRWHGWQDRMREAPVVVCHGDLHPGNVLPTRDGPVVLDWDLRCRGPVAWDHGPLLQWGDRWDTTWGGGPHAYPAFAGGYGRSLRDDWLGEALAAMRGVIATLMRVRAGRTDPAAAVEAQRRLRFWRGEPDAPLWTPQ